MKPEIIYPLIAMFLTAVSVGGTMFFSRTNAKRNDILDLRQLLKDQKLEHDEKIKALDGRMLLCEAARDNLAKENLALLKQLVLGQQTAASELVTSNKEIAQRLEESNKKPNMVDTIESPKVKVEAVK